MGHARLARISSWIFGHIRPIEFVNLSCKDWNPKPCDWVEIWDMTWFMMWLPTWYPCVVRCAANLRHFLLWTCVNLLRGCVLLYSYGGYYYNDYYYPKVWSETTWKNCPAMQVMSDTVLSFVSATCHSKPKASIGTRGNWRSGQKVKSIRPDASYSDTQTFSCFN